jgi:hypothetical protein
MPRSIAKRIADRIAKNNEPVVVTSRDGKPSRVFSLRQYLKMVDLPNQVKPWEHRERKSEIPDPLGAVDFDLPSELRRKDLYGED